MSETTIEKFFCNKCKGKTNHFIRSSYEKTDTDDHDGTSRIQRVLIIECCGCEHLALVKKTHFSEHIDYGSHPVTGEMTMTELWDEVIYPPVTYRASPTWFDDLPDPTLRAISEEIYKSLQTGSHYLATFGSRTLIDRLIVLTVGDKRNFSEGLNALKDEGKISENERNILKPVIEAGNAAAHRGWAPTKDQLAVILDTVEGLIHRLLVLPKLTEELEEDVPSRNGKKKSNSKKIISQIPSLTIKNKIEISPKELRELYNELHDNLKSLGDDVSIHPQKHYMAFRRNRNFASVQVYNQKRIIRIYLNVDPDAVEEKTSNMRDVRQIGHFGTGDLEVTIKTKKDIEAIAGLIRASYEAS